jgi:Ankyrin repeats (3 copies)
LRLTKASGLADERMPQDPKTLSIGDLAKFGYFEALCRRAATIENLDLAYLFDRAVADFRTVKRKPEHQKILQWCIDQGLDFDARAGWMNQSVVCLAAQYGNNEIIASMMGKGLPENPFARASVGDLEFLEAHAARYRLSDLKDANHFNLLFYCAGSGLGRRDAHMKRRLAEVCRLLLDHGVSPSHEEEGGMWAFPAFLCAWWGGNEEVMRLLLDRGGLRAERFPQVLEWSLEPHVRSGDPFYHVARVVLDHGFDINMRPERGRTLLHGAANRGTIKAVRWLLQNGADPNALDGCGRTPLHVSAERNTSISVIKLLIDAGSDPNARDPSGKTALNYARAKKRVKVVAYLASIGATEPA